MIFDIVFAVAGRQVRVSGNLRAFSLAIIGGTWTLQDAILDNVPSGVDLDECQINTVAVPPLSRLGPRTVWEHVRLRCPTARLRPTCDKHHTASPE